MNAQTYGKNPGIFSGHQRGLYKSSRQDEEYFLTLPCDWRFFPKLGPLRLDAPTFFCVYPHMAELSRGFLRKLGIL